MAYDMRLYSSDVIAYDAGIVYDQTEGLMQDEINASVKSNISGSLLNFAAAYSSSSTYNVGNYCTYNNKLYRCTTAISVSEAWNSLHWTQVTTGSELLAIKSNISDVSEIIAPFYSDSATYAIGDYCIYNNHLYICNTNIQVAESWTAAHWTATDIAEELDDVQNDISTNVNNIATVNTKVNNLTNSISDAYSSSSTYALGDLCIYNNTLYRCTTAITTPESWSNVKWTATTVETEINNAISTVNAKLEEKDLVFTISSVSSLPVTFTNNLITADHMLTYAFLSNQNAQISDWTVTTARTGSTGTVTISGSAIPGNVTTDITLVLTKSITITDQTSV